MQYKYDVTTTKKSWGTNSKKYIMLHHTGGISNLWNMTQYLAKNKAQVSCHYLVGVDGSISRIGTDDYIMWHAGLGSKIPGVINNMNAHSIGIEVVSNGINFTEAQVKGLAELIKDIQKRHGIKTENIIRHKDYSTRKWDIGDNFFKVMDCDSFEEWKRKYITGIKWGDYRNLAGKSPFTFPEKAGKVLGEGTPDEKLAVVEIMSKKIAERVIKEKGLT